MKTIGCINDLREFGIFPLTGEADALSYRILCDVTANGKRVIEEAFGGIQLTAENWNPGSANDRHMASVMLAHEAYRQIAPIALMDRCHTVIGTKEGVIIGFESGEEYIPAEWQEVDGEIVESTPPRYRIGDRTSMRWPSSYGEPQRVYRRMAGSVGNRCQHAMSGRVA